MSESDLTTRVSQADVAVIGAGIVGLAHAWSAAARGHRVTVFERSPRAYGASIRNFGMVWPIGQPAGELYRLALTSRERWLVLSRDAGIWADRCGSIHVAHREDEWAVLQEFAGRAGDTGCECSLLSPDDVRSRAPGVREEELVGGLFSPTEVVVNPRQAIDAIPGWLTEQFGVRLLFNTNVVAVRPGDAPSGGASVHTATVQTADGAARPFGRVICCGGAEASLLFPTELAHAGLTTCKLQMLRTPPQPGGWRMGPLLASGLTLRHYRSFETCPSLPALKNRIREETPELDRFGIHVMAAQSEAGDVILGDSHEYDEAIEPFDKPLVDELILRELRKILRLPDWTIAERWHGRYTKHPLLPAMELEPFPGIHICTGTGGAGMTLAFGLAEAAWRRWTEEC